MSDSTLFMQLQVFDIEPAAGPRAMVSALSRRLREKNISSVIYGDAGDHRGIAILSWANNPGDILDNVHALLGGKRFSALTPRPGWVMFGHVDGEDATAASEKVLAENASWATWYPVKNNAAYAGLSDDQKASSHREHGAVAAPFIEAERVSHIRLDSNGIDAEGNHHVFGLLAGDLLSISELQAGMAGTAQVAQYTEKTGPVFIGRRIWQNPELAKPGVEETDESVDAEAEAGADAAEGDAVENAEETTAEDTPAAETSDANGASEGEGASESDDSSEG